MALPLGKVGEPMRRQERLQQGRPGSLDPGQNEAPQVKSKTGQLIAIVVVLALSACGQPASTASGEDCLPSTPDSVEPPGDPDRRIEDIIEYLTGERQTDDVPVEEKVDDPNFGGVWGDFEGGVVVAVLFRGRRKSARRNGGGFRLFASNRSALHVQTDGGVQRPPISGPPRTQH